MSSVCVVIPTHNRRENLRTVLLCLKAQVTQLQVIPVVIVDGSADGTFEMLREDFPECTVIKGDGNWWYTKCINEGLAEAIRINSDYVLTLNDDVYFDPTYLDGFHMSMKEIGSVAILGSASFTMSLPHRITFSGIKKVISWRLKEVNYIRKFSVANIAELRGVRPSMNLSGRGMFFNTEILRLTGLLDENFPQYGSDTDFSYRAVKLGIPVFVSFDAKIFENEKLTSKGATYNKPSLEEYLASFFNKYSVNSLNKSLRYYRKHGVPILLPFYLGYLFIGSIYVYFFKYRKVI